MPFPLFLHHLLDAVENDGNAHIFSWTPNSRAINIHDSKAFAEVIIPKYMPSMSHYKSFLKQLGLYGFTRRKDPGLSRYHGIYEHPHFVRHDLVSCFLIKRSKIRSVPAKLDRGMVDRHLSSSIGASYNMSFGPSSLNSHGQFPLPKTTSKSLMLTTTSTSSSLPDFGDTSLDSPQFQEWKGARNRQNNNTSFRGCPPSPFSSSGTCVSASAPARVPSPSIDSQATTNEQASESTSSQEEPYYSISYSAEYGESMLLRMKALLQSRTDKDEDLLLHAPILEPIPIIPREYCPNPQAMMIRGGYGGNPFTSTVIESFLTAAASSVASTKKNDDDDMSCCQPDYAFGKTFYHLSG
jgi:hypothetical protein